MRLNPSSPQKKSSTLESPSLKQPMLKKTRQFKLIRVGQQNYGLFFKPKGISIQKQERFIDFYSRITETKLDDIPLKKLNQRDRASLPSVVERLASEGLVQLFFDDTEQGYTLYLLNECNQTEVYRQLYGSKEAIINKANQFYTNYNYSGEDNHKFHFNLPQYYQIKHSLNGETTVEPYFNSTSLDH